MDTAEYTVDALVDVEVVLLTPLLELSKSVAAVLADGTWETEGGMKARSSVG